MVRSVGQNPQTTKILLPCKCFEIRFLAEHNSIPTTLHWCPGILTAINQMIGFPTSGFHIHHTCYMCVMPSSSIHNCTATKLLLGLPLKSPLDSFFAPSVAPHDNFLIPLLSFIRMVLSQLLTEAFWPLGMPTLCALNIVPRSLLFFSFWATKDTITITSRSSSSTSQHYIRKICRHRASYCSPFSSHPVFFPSSLHYCSCPVLIEHSTSISQ